MNGRTQSDEDIALGFAVVACMFGVAVWLGYVVPAIVLGILLALGVLALIPTRR
jgi:hypothetical protein